MRKIYLSILSVALVSGVNAQIKSNHLPVKKTNDTGLELRPEKPARSVEKALPIWENDFSVEAEWTVSNSSVPAQDWFWTTDPADVPAFGPATMTTAANGYWMIDSDGAGQTATQDANLDYVGTIDLSAYSNVVLEFEHHYRTYLDTRTVFISTDGGTIWQPIVVTDGTEANTNVDGVFAANISAIAGGQASVMLRFNYVGAWGWHWAVDDVRIIEQPLDDIQVLSAWITGTNNEGFEYGRTPENHLDASWLVGAEVFNFGVNAQTNVDLDMDFVSFSSNAVEPALASDATVLMENTESPALTVGLYDGTYTATSDGESGGASFGNNTFLRSFEVTTDVYSQDGIDVYPASELVLASIGTNSFTDAGTGEVVSADAFVLASMYHFKTTDQVAGFRVMLANGTVAGGEILGSFKDTATFWQDDMTSMFNTNVTMVTAQDITNGYVDVMFPSPVTLNPGAYYAAIELYSNANANDIRVLDDETVPQPSFASAIFIAGDGSYTNGTALGIRMLMDDVVGVDENTLTGVSVYPNPSAGVINVTNDNNAINAIEVHDMLGKVVFTSTVSTSTTIDLSGNGTGVYIVKVSNENGTMVERVVIK